MQTGIFIKYVLFCFFSTGLDNLSKCSELRCLKLGICSDISDKGLSYIASHCKIKELDLYRYCVSYITHHGFDLYAMFLKLLCSL